MNSTEVGLRTGEMQVQGFRWRLQIEMKTQHVNLQNATSAFETHLMRRRRRQLPS